MVYYETGSRLQLAREHADRPEAEMRRSRRLMPDEAGFFSRARLAPGPGRPAGTPRPAQGPPHSCL
jgi:hypothetical protein